VSRASVCRLGPVALLSIAAFFVGSGTPAASDGAPRTARAAGEDSPWPRTEALRPNVRAVRREVNRLARQVELMELSVARYDDWETCLTYVPVSEYGDRDRQFGYHYDERDGTGPGFMDALAVDRRSRPRREDYMFIDFERDGCRSDSPRPGGTAEPASMQPVASASEAAIHPLWPQPQQPAVRRSARRADARSAARGKRRGTLKSQVSRLERRAERLFRRTQALETASERFDEWESCVSWVPVTEMGDPDGKFGYLFGSVGAAPSYRPALHIDRSDWDDPDYMFLALVGGDRPGRTCQDEPGEAVD
jgi:hypothetical protein